MPLSRLILFAALLLGLPWVACVRDAGGNAAGAGEAGKQAPAVVPETKSASASGTAAADTDCNLQTALVPGIPGSPGHLIKSERNPNGDSELAVLMRKFVDDLRDARTLVEAKQPLKQLYPTHRRMRCAWPTKPEERNEGYDTRSQAYLAAVRAFDGEPTKANYNNIVAACIACHTVSCGGVLDFIGDLKWQ